MLFGNINKKFEKYRLTDGAVLIDVREKEEFTAGHIPNAVNIPLSTIQSISLPKDTPIFLYCLRGARSARAVKILKKAGYTNVSSIGGISSYKGEIER